MACGPVFLSPRSIGVNLNNSAVERDCFNFDRDQTFSQESFKHSIKHTIFTPSAHAGINGMPVAKLFRQAAPLAAVFGNVQDGMT
jgi:hypothetical protein